MRIDGYWIRGALQQQRSRVGVPPKTPSGEASPGRAMAVGGRLDGNGRRLLRLFCGSDLGPGGTMENFENNYKNQGNHIEPCIPTQFVL